MEGATYVNKYGGSGTREVSLAYQVQSFMLGMSVHLMKAAVVCLR